VPPVWSRGRAPGWRVRGQSRLEAVSFWAFGHQKETVNLSSFLYFANSVVQTSADMIQYIDAAQSSTYHVYHCIGIWVNQYSTWGVFCCRWRVAYPSHHLTNQNLGIDDFAHCDFDDFEENQHKSLLTFPWLLCSSLTFQVFAVSGQCMQLFVC